MGKAWPGSQEVAIIATISGNDITGKKYDLSSQAKLSMTNKGK
jgi:hypothetical protein